jgi:hypothetical protein
LMRSRFLSSLSVWVEECSFISSTIL